MVRHQAGHRRADSGADWSGTAHYGANIQWAGLPARRDGSIKPLVGRYYSRISQLHGACFYDGICNEETERRIRETDAYIRDASNPAYDGLLNG